MPVKIVSDGDGSPTEGVVQSTYLLDRDRKHDDHRGEFQILGSITDTIAAVKDAEANLAATNGQQFAQTVMAVKDAEANLAATNGEQFTEVLEAVKDAEADLERSSGLHYADTVKTIKDSEGNIERELGRDYADTVKTIKDVEAQLDRASGNRYADTVKTLKDVESTLERSEGLTRDVVRQAELAVERTREKIVDVIRQAELESCKEFDTVRHTVEKAEKDILVHQISGFKDTVIEFQKTHNLMNQLAAAAEKTACQNQMQTLLQFKDQALLSEKLAAQASRELAECCCEMKELVRADGQKTRDLINSQEVDRLRERANKAEQQLTLLQLGIGVPGLKA